jgi:hypothetical protein
MICPVLKLPLIAPRRRKYNRDSGEVWKRKKRDLLRPDAFTTRAIRHLRDSTQPGFETLQQQKPGRQRPRVHQGGTFFDLPAGRIAEGHIACLLSIEPGQRGGATNS